MKFILPVFLLAVSFGQFTLRAQMDSAQIQAFGNEEGVCFHNLYFIFQNRHQGCWNSEEDSGPVFYAIYEDDQNNLWFLSNNSIIQFNKSTQTTKVFLKEEDSNRFELNRILHFRDTSGNLYFEKGESLSGFYLNNEAWFFMLFILTVLFSVYLFYRWKTPNLLGKQKLPKPPATAFNRLVEGQINLENEHPKERDFIFEFPKQKLSSVETTSRVPQPIKEKLKNTKETEDKPSPSPECLILLLAEMTNEDRRWMEQLKGLVKKELTNQQFDVYLLAEKMSISPRQLQRRSRQLTGLSPQKYIQEVRMIQARHLLESKKYDSVKAVALEIGLQNAGYFGQVYKKRFGKLPSEYI